MILDETLEFCSATDISAAAGTALAGDVVDLTVARDIGQTGRPLYLVIQCTTSIITAGAAGTITFTLASDAAAAIATDGTATEHVVTQAFVTDGDDANDLDAGAIIAAAPLPMPSSVYPYERYLGLLVTIATTTVTAGNIDAFLTWDVARWTSHADAVN